MNLVTNEARRKRLFRDEINSWMIHSKKADNQTHETTRPNCREITCILTDNHRSSTSLVSPPLESLLHISTQTRRTHSQSTKLVS